LSRRQGEILGLSLHAFLILYPLESLISVKICDAREDTQEKQARKDLQGEEKY